MSVRGLSRQWIVGALCMYGSMLALLGAPAGAFAAGPPVIEEAGSVLGVTSTSAKLQARIDPDESETTYRFEYGTSEAYGSKIPLPDGSVGSGSTGVTVSVEPEGLSPGTTYHYRVVAIAASRSETIDGGDETFTTQAAGGEFSLPDGRQWEMVSPPNKQGATIFPLGEYGVIEAADDGAAITYLTNAPTELEPKGFSGLYGQILSKRSGQGWSTQAIATPNDAPTDITVSYGLEYRFFSSNLSLALVEPIGEGFTPLSAEATERTPYIRHNSSCQADATTCYEPLTTPADVRAGAKFGGEPEEYAGEASFANATSNLSHVLIQDFYGGLTSTPGDEGGLYEWPPAADEQLQLVSILPESEGETPAEVRNTRAGSQESGRGVISDDGSRVFWSVFGFSSERLYLRDTVKHKTLRIGNATADEFQIANTDGSRVFFIAKETEYAREGTLEACDVIEVAAKLACQTTALAPEVQRGVIGSSEDGSYVYFVSKASFAAKALSGADNLYVDHYNSTTWEAPSLIATLPKEDENDWSNELKDLTARVSPNGEWLSFMSRKSLTGYDNRDAVSGEPDEEVYLYNASTKRLACASCDPTGARPVGMQYGVGGDAFLQGLLGGGDRVWPPETWLAANISGWSRGVGTSSTLGSPALYQSRYLSNEGRLFFNSDDALVPQDVNGTWDVYEYEPEGIGSCASASTSGSVVYRRERVTATGAVEPSGCVGLISSGESPEQSAFMDASENGDDVFILTSSRLSPQDIDTSFDIYDAHVCSASAPCLPSAASPAPCDTADACRAAPTPQPEVFEAPPSATFSGTGNVNPVAASGAKSPQAKSRPVTPSQRLAGALRACRKKPRRERAACERVVRRRYAHAGSGKKATAKRRGK